MNECERLYREVGKRIARARRRGGGRITQQALAAAIGLSRTSIANIERGRQQLLVHHLVGMARFLGVQPGSLLPAPEEPHPELAAILEGIPGGRGREWIERSLATTADGAADDQRQKGAMNGVPTARDSSPGQRPSGSKPGGARARARRTDRSKPRR